MLYRIGPHGDFQPIPSYTIHLRLSLFVSGFDIDLRVIGLLKTVTFAGAVTFSGAETEDIAQWVNLVGSGS
jgi:hypothetical protein